MSSFERRHAKSVTMRHTPSKRGTTALKSFAIDIANLHAASGFRACLGLSLHITGCALSLAVTRASVAATFGCSHLLPRERAALAVRKPSSGRRFSWGDLLQRQQTRRRQSETASSVREFRFAQSTQLDNHLAFLSPEFDTRAFLFYAYAESQGPHESHRNEERQD
jgi:hypothetical protein